MRRRLAARGFMSSSPSAQKLMGPSMFILVRRSRLPPSAACAMLLVAFVPTAALGQTPATTVDAANSVLGRTNEALTASQQQIVDKLKASPEAENARSQKSWAWSRTC